VAIAYRRDVFEKVGLFDETFDACEDVEFNHRIDRAGLRCYFTPTVAVRYRPRNNLRRLFYQMMRYGRGRVRLLKKHPGTLSLGTFVPLVFVAGLLGGIPLCFAALFNVVVPLLWPIYLGTVIIYAVIVGLSSLAIAASKRNPLMAVRLPCVFATVHIGSGIGMLLECFTRQSPSNHRSKDS